MNCTEIWDAFLHIIEQNIPERQYCTWFKPIKPVSFVADDCTLVVEVPSDFFREYIEDSYLTLIKKALNRVIGPQAKLGYVLPIVQKAQPMVVPASPGNAAVNKPVLLNSSSPADNPNPFVYPGIKKVRINTNLVPSYCFENVVQGSCNKLAVNAGLEISAKPGKTPFNPLFIFGGPGLGKTLMAQAIGNEINRLNPDLVVLYVTGNEFKTQYMEATYVRNKLVDFMAFYKRIDVLIVDDIHELVGQGAQMAFFNIFNHLHQNNKQLIFTSDRAPVELHNFEERLLSRFKWGLSVELSHPDYETRLKVLQNRCKREGVVIGAEVLEYLASNVKSNFRELEGTLISVIAHATASHQENSVELAAHITSQLVSEQRHELSISKVQETVCEYFNLTLDDMLSKSRRRQIVQARQIAMYLCRTLMNNCSLASIGAEIGGKDHATVLHACNTVSDLMSTDRLFKKYVVDIQKLLNPQEL